APGAAAAAATLLAARFPGLPVVGQYGAPYGFEREPAEMDALRRQLEQTRPAIVFVALGSPKQERLIRELRHDLPGAWWLGVGISFSFVCGQVKRAPRWMQKAGLEWAHRLAQEPRRLGRRYLVEGPPFAASLLWHAGVCRCRGRGVKVEAAGAGTPL
ncbi:MAG: WecB/TagA/CpsF family glycosyltransferase, partial [Phycisphaeraceae bacterium]